MKKLHILIPSLVATASMPFVSLVGCGGDTPQSEEVKFSTADGQMTSSTVGTLQLDWTPTDHNLVFENNWAFTSSQGNTDQIVVDTSRPKTLILTFDNDIAQNITNGKLTFTYTDKTTKQEGVTAVVENIRINVYTPPTPVIFSVSEGQMDSETTGTIKLNANPATHDLVFHPDKWAFTSESMGEATTVSYDDASQTVSLAFSEEISTEIDDGVLSFVYDDADTGEDNISVTINDVHLDAFRLNFNTCDWKDVKDKCQKFESTRKEEELVDNFYFDDLSTPKEEHIIPTSINDFVGQQRIVHLDGKDDKYYVRVVGVCQDYYDQTSPYAYTALTFQFDTLIGDLEGKGIQWNKNATNLDYWSSTINSYLNSETFLSRFFDFDYKNEIKPVFRTAICRGTVTLSTSQVYCFMPVLANIFSAQGLANSFADPQLYINEGQRPNATPLATTQYAYYQNEIVDGALCTTKDNLDSAILYDALHRKKLDGSVTNQYWLTTPHITTPSFAFFIDDMSGGKGKVQSHLVSLPNCIAPCFCI